MAPKRATKRNKTKNSNSFPTYSPENKTNKKTSKMDYYAESHEVDSDVLELNNRDEAFTDLKKFLLQSDIIGNKGGYLINVAWYGWHRPVRSSWPDGCILIRGRAGILICSRARVAPGVRCRGRSVADDFISTTAAISLAVSNTSVIRTDVEPIGFGFPVHRRDTNVRTSQPDGTKIRQHPTHYAVDVYGRVVGREHLVDGREHLVDGPNPLCCGSSILTRTRAGLPETSGVEFQQKIPADHQGFLRPSPIGGAQDQCGKNWKTSGTRLVPDARPWS